MTDEEAAVRFQKHRKRIVSTMARRYYPLDTDIIDMLYTDCWEHIQRIAGRTSIQHLNQYLGRTVHNRIKNYLRDKSRSNDMFERGVSILNFPTENEERSVNYTFEQVIDTNAIESAQQQHAFECVDLTMAAMPRTLAQVGVWNIIEHKTTKEIGVILNCSQQWVSILLRRFKTEFKRRYKKFYHS